MDKKAGFSQVKMTSYAEGDGLLLLGPGRESSVHYSIGIWRTPDGHILGKGYISGAVEAMCAAAYDSRPLPLRLRGGNAIDVVVTERGAGRTGLQYPCRSRPFVRVSLPPHSLAPQ